MIDLTVKTLDSQNHAFSLADDITIREFKEHIAETVNVPADSQRLIYCGRVLQDEKHLSEYDVNGKVIHLVQRAPPQSAQRGNSGGGHSHGQNQGRGDHPQTPRVQYHQARTQFHGNPMYLGSISIPAEVVEGHELPIPRLSSTLTNSRLVVARRMLDQANRVLDRLENPTAAAAAAATTSASDSNAPENDEPSSANGATGTSDVPMQEQLNNTAERIFRNHSASGQIGGMYEIAAAIAGSIRSRRVFPMRSSEDASGTEPSAPAAEGTDETETPPQEQQQQGSANASTDQSGNARTSSSTAPQPPRPPQMAQLLGRLMDTQDRLRPFLLRYRELMELDPEIPGGRTASGEDIGTVEDNQRIADGVTECFHFLSHANHALSDVIVDAGQQPPRNLRCRPMLIQHSAILQAGIPIQVEAHISVARNDGSNGESGEESSDATSRPPNSTTVTPPTTQNPVDLTFATEQPEQTPATTRQQSEPQQQAQSQPQIDSPFGAIFNLANNMEVLMEMGPSESGGGITVSGLGGATGNEQNQTNGSSNNNNVNNNNNNAPGTSGVAGIFPWGPAPPEVMRNLMNFVAGYMAQSAATVAAVATTTTTATPTTCLRQRAMAAAVGGGAAPNPGQSTQARSNVGTHPTTSTQTRSTARPHVFHPHAHPLGVGVGMEQNMDFDPFLPCHSHHIRRIPSATPNNSAATSSPQQTSQPSQSTTPNGNAQTQPDGPSGAADQNASNSTLDQRTSNIRLRDEIANLQRSSGAESGQAVTLEELLLARGINITERSAGSTLLQRLFTACARIELSEWYALLNNGKFSRDDTWRRLRPHLTSLMLFDGLDCEERFIDEITTEIKPYLRGIWGADERPINVGGGRWIDVSGNIDYLIYHYVEELALYVKRNVQTPDDVEWGLNLTKIVQRFGREICSTLRNYLRRKQAGMEDLIRLFATRAMSSHHGELREWVVGTVVEWFCEYSRQRDGDPETENVQEMIPMGRATFTESEEISGSNEANDIPRSHETQPAPEPMETEEASGNRTINDPLDLDDGQEVPATFPGHESLLPEWVPIIARDGIRQRRQLQLQGTGVTTFSDAYLDGLPTKRRKLVDQQKPRLLVSPTPNHSSIPASMERLVRDSVVRAGVEEADGAAAAVAADPGVRRAFGQAIRECLNPRRLQTPDFPDPRRFPNATSYFTDKERPPK